jgi:ubiquinone/menaquinone biosynthesis C-methylase UbiE
MKENINYTLPVGEDEFIRLMGLNEICNPFTLNFLDEYVADITACDILDIGCGLGVISRELAARANQGSVIGIDISEEQINMAKRLTAEAQCSNLHFQNLAVENVAELEKKFDLVYFRFVIEHQENPYKMLEAIDSILKENGRAFIEVVTSYDAMFSDPDSEAIQEWKSLILYQPKLCNTDFYIGKRLNSYFKSKSYTVKAQKLSQPIMTNNSSRDKFLSGMKGEKIRQLYIDSGFVTATEYDKKVDDLLLYAEQDNIIAFPQYTQLLVQKLG